MKRTDFILWLASGGLITLGIYIGPFLLRFAERFDDKEEERLWNHLLHPERL